MTSALLEKLQGLADLIPELDGERQYWFIRTNRGRFYDDFYYSNSVGIGYNLVSLPQIRKALSHEPNPYGELVKVLAEKYPKELEAKTIGKPAGLFLRFYEEMKAGDVVVMPSAGKVKYAFGVVTDGKPFEVDSNSFEEDEIYRKRRPVQWIAQKDFHDLDSNLYQAFRAPQALSTLNRYASFIDREMHAIYTKDGKTHFRLNIDTEGAVDGNDYFPMGSILLDLAEYFRQQAGIDSSFSEIIVRQNVQSKGLLEFISKHKMLSFFILCASYVGLEGGDFEVEKIGMKFHVQGLIPEVIDFYKEYNKQHNLEAKQQTINAILAGKMKGVDAKLTLDALRIMEGQAPIPSVARVAEEPDSATTATRSAAAVTAATASLANPTVPVTLADSASQADANPKNVKGNPKSVKDNSKNAKGKL